MSWRVDMHGSVLDDDGSREMWVTAFELGTRTHIPLPRPPEPVDVEENDDR